MLKIRNASLITVVLVTLNRCSRAMSVVRSPNHHLQVLVLLPRSRLQHRHVADLWGGGAGLLGSKQVLNLQVKPEYVSIHQLLRESSRNRGDPTRLLQQTIVRHLMLPGGEIDDFLRDGVDFP